MPVISFVVVIVVSVVIQGKPVNEMQFEVSNGILAHRLLNSDYYESKVTPRIVSSKKSVI